MRRNDKRNDRSTRNGRNGRNGRTPANARRKSTLTGTREQVQCRFCRGQIKYIDFKDVETLQKLLTNRGKIYSRKRSGNCAACQRKAKRAIKLARFMALLPYTA